MRDWLRTLHDRLAAGEAPLVRVVVAAVRGSAPREPGACMLVGAAAEHGTVGGGHLELVATQTARAMLQAPAGSARLDRFPLAAALGQCCGGIVELWFQRYDAADIPALAFALHARDSEPASVVASSMNPGRPRAQLLDLATAMAEGAEALDQDATLAVLVQHADGPVLYERLATRVTELWLFGAGHVGRALVNVLSPLPFRVTWVDSREGMFPAMLPASVTPLHSPQPADEVADMPPDAWALVMTHSHDEDLALCEALLARGTFGWAGVIGSIPKTKRFRQRLAQRGFEAAAIARLAMPIGIGGIRSKEPGAIAVAVAAQLLLERESRGERARAGHASREPTAFGDAPHGISGSS
jgi:xanthine dehydrogenase accessory factor